MEIKSANKNFRDSIFFANKNFYLKIITTKCELSTSIAKIKSGKIRAEKKMSRKIL